MITELESKEGKQTHGTPRQTQVCPFPCPDPFLKKERFGFARDGEAAERGESVSTRTSGSDHEGVCPQCECVVVVEHK